MEKVGRIQNTLQNYKYQKIPVHERCPFCKIASKHLIEPGHVLLIPDKNPQAQIHMLAIPKSHTIESVLQLFDIDVPLIKEMQNKCLEYMRSKKVDVQTVIMGFHIRVFTSVSH